MKIWRRFKKITELDYAVLRNEREEYNKLIEKLRKGKNAVLNRRFPIILILKLNKNLKNLKFIWNSQ